MFLIQKTLLQAFCATRWVERWNSIIPIFSVYTLDKLEEDLDREISTKAGSFNSIIKLFNLFVSLEIVANLFSYIKRLSIRLQSP